MEKIINRRESLYKLFTFYSTEERTRKSGIYRYRFTLGDRSFIELYQKIIEIFELQDRFHSDIDGVFLVQTTSQKYYFTIFCLGDRKYFSEKFEAFENWVGDRRCEKYVEDRNNKWIYDSVGGDVGFYECGIDYYNPEEGPLYSYWNWVYDMNHEEVERYILLEKTDSVVGSKNMYLLHEGLLQLSKESNFYNIYFDYVTVPSNTEEVDKVLEVNKKKTLVRQFREYKKLMNNKKRFKKHWLHVPHERSYMPIEYIGLIDLIINLKLDVYHTDIEFAGDKESQFESVYDLYNSKFHIISGLEVVIMVKPKRRKKHKIFFITKHRKEGLREEIESTLRVYDKEVIVGGLGSLEYDFYMPEKDPEKRITADCFNNFRKVHIEINSIVVGIYSRDKKVCDSFGALLGCSLINPDYPFFKVDDYELYVEEKGCTFEDYLKMCDEGDKYDIWFYSKEDMKFMRGYDIHKQGLFVRLGEA